MISIRNRITEKLIEEILKKSKFSDPVEYLEARVKHDFDRVSRKKKLM